MDLYCRQKPDELSLPINGVDRKLDFVILKKNIKVYKIHISTGKPGMAPQTNRSAC
jgi:hypothetical protein